MFNKLLQRQIGKYLGGVDQLPEYLLDFLQVVSDSYDHYEKDRKMLERSIELSSNEMIELNSFLRKETAELKKAHKELDTLFKSIEEVFYSVDLNEFRIIQISDACEKVCGYDSDQFLTVPNLLTSIIHPEDQFVIKEAREELFEGNSVTKQYRILHKDGSIRWIESKTAPTLDEHGKVVRIDGVLNDITEKKQSEHEMLDLIHRLQLTNKELRQFAYIVSHNLRAPLAKIQGLVSLLSNNTEEELASDTLIEYIATEADNLDCIVRDMNVLLTARNTEDTTREYTMFDSELTSVKEVLGREIAKSGAQIIADFLDCPGLVTIKFYLYSIMYNLVSNAIKYRHKDVALCINLKTSRIGNFICLSVEDNGMGIDLAKHGSKLFGLYKRFHTETIPGKGLGLILVKIQIESLGGKVEVESVPNKGTVFKVFFPEE